mgnify:CR=1 FL=1
MNGQWIQRLAQRHMIEIVGWQRFRLRLHYSRFRRFKFIQPRSIAQPGCAVQYNTLFILAGDA